MAHPHTRFSRANTGLHVVPLRHIIPPRDLCMSLSWRSPKNGLAARNRSFRPLKVKVASDLPAGSASGCSSPGSPKRWPALGSRRFRSRASPMRRHASFWRPLSRGFSNTTAHDGFGDARGRRRAADHEEIGPAPAGSAACDQGHAGRLSTMLGLFLPCPGHCMSVKAVGRLDRPVWMARAPQGCLGLAHDPLARQGGVSDAQMAEGCAVRARQTRPGSSYAGLGSSAAGFSSAALHRRCLSCI